MTRRFQENPLTVDWFRGTTPRGCVASLNPRILASNAKFVTETIQAAAEDFLANVPKLEVKPWDPNVRVMDQLWPEKEGAGGKNLLTLFEGQWVDNDAPGVPAEYPAGLEGFEKLVKQAAAWGFEGIELADWRFDTQRICTDDEYVRSIHGILGQNGMEAVAYSNHCKGQGVCDNIDIRHQSILPPYVWGDGEPYGVNVRCAMATMQSGYAARRLGCGVMNGFTGSSIWHLLYSFPPVSQAMIDAGYALFGERFTAILEVFAAIRLAFALEVHPTEIAFDLETAQKALEAIASLPHFGFNFDPSHLIWQGIDPATFIRKFPDRVFHVHDKDCLVRKQNGSRGILGSLLNFGDDRRGWDFVSGGHGNVDFGSITRALNDVGYRGPRSTEWEDSGMDRANGAPETLAVVEGSLFGKSQRRFDAGMETGSK